MGGFNTGNWTTESVCLKKAVNTLGIHCQFTNPEIYIKSFSSKSSPVMDKVFQSFTLVKVATLLYVHCKNTPLQVKVLHSKSYLRKSMEVDVEGMTFACNILCKSIFSCGIAMI